jgi:hypothetical protein
VYNLLVLLVLGLTFVALLLRQTSCSCCFSFFRGAQRSRRSYRSVKLSIQERNKADFDVSREQSNHFFLHLISPLSPALLFYVFHTDDLDLESRPGFPSYTSYRTRRRNPRSRLSFDNRSRSMLSRLSTIPTSCSPITLRYNHFEMLVGLVGRNLQN